ncbi:signal transduction protein [Actinokineospora fastidiosa]|uniref:Signal transduction protein n=2 Tax=Pseudonocardiaceae TaxID=2070 RepID=A0A918GRN1_9PSEU|nr:putative manganese-dependent inorganic pyrophosphatase [Actinokineospora sp. UTMC 2448]GGS52788.1 signal transduction protein [Actinokineospora fastidiosa]
MGDGEFSDRPNVANLIVHVSSDGIGVTRMRISDVLRSKGSTVATVDPGLTVAGMLAELARHNVGALVVVDGDTVVGIVSERDVVRGLAERGGGLLDVPVAEIMTAEVFTCEPGDTVDSLAGVMTERRIRHMPVLSGGALVGIVSIGDVVKSRISQLESDRDQLTSYIQG